jgi:hypothetical protein
MCETTKDQDLLGQIGREGDALWDGQIESEADGSYVDIRDVPPEVFQSPLHDIAIALGLVIAGVLWRLERAVSSMLGRTYFCPLCHNPMEEPLVSCPHCRRVQSRLRPTVGGVFIRRCRCGGGRWRVLGSLFSPPKPLVCRDTESFTGCYRPHRIPDLAGRHRSINAAILGTSVAAKHAFMADMLTQLARRHRPAWSMSKLELRLCREVLVKGFEEDTTRYESPGCRYTLSRTLILHGRRRTLWVFHNLLNTWLVSEEALHKNAPFWGRVRGILIVIDGDRLAGADPVGADHPAELYSRTLRDIEKLGLVSPGDALPMNVAVVVACSSREKMGDLLSHAQPGIGGPVKSAVMGRDPALHGLLVRTVHPKKLRFWAWVAPSGANRPSHLVAEEVGVWIMTR